MASFLNSATAMQAILAAAPFTGTVSRGIPVTIA